MNKGKLFLFLTILLLPMNIYCDTVILKTGQRVEGKIVAQDTDSVTIDFEGIELKYYHSDIENVERATVAVASSSEQEPVPYTVTQSDAPTLEDADPFTRGEKLLQDNRLWEAISAFKEASERDLKDDKSRYNVAGAYFLLGRFDDAIIWYKKTLDINPGHVNSHIGIGIAYRLLLKYDDAVKELLAAINLDKKNSSAMVELATAYQACEDWENAIVWYKKSLEIDVNRASVWHFLGMSCGRLRQYDEAVKAFKTAIEIDPNYADVYLSLAATLLGMEKRKLDSGERADFVVVKDYLSAAAVLYKQIDDKPSLERIDVLLNYIKSIEEKA